MLNALSPNAPVRTLAVNSRTACSTCAAVRSSGPVPHPGTQPRDAALDAGSNLRQSGGESLGDEPGREGEETQSADEDHDSRHQPRGVQPGQSVHRGLEQRGEQHSGEQRQRDQRDSGERLEGEVEDDPEQHETPGPFGRDPNRPWDHRGGASAGPPPGS